MTCAGTPPPRRLGLRRGERRPRPAVDALDRAREAVAELRERFARRLARAAHRPRHGHEHERRGLHAGRPPQCLRTRRPPARAGRGRTGGRDARAGARRRRPGGAAHRAGSRPPRRHDGRAERSGRRCLAHEPRLHLPAPHARLGPLHVHRHLHGDRTVTPALSLAAAAGALALATVAPAPPRPSLTASPSRVVLSGATRARVRVVAPRGVQLVDVALTPYALDLRGRPRLGGAARAPAWVSVRPARLRVGRKGAVVTLAARPPRGARAGRPAVRARPHDPARRTAGASPSVCASASSSWRAFPGRSSAGS